MTTLRPDLAIKTKHAGDTQDYRVLSCTSHGLTRERFERIFYDFSVGSMPDERFAPGEQPPWITAGPVAEAGQIYLALVRQEWTDQHDHSGRHIKQSSCLCLPYADLARAQATLTDLSAHMPPACDMDASIRQDRPIDFMATPDRNQRITQVIDDTGYAFMAAVAALVMSRPVALLGAHDLTVEQRLDYLDAILGLLPYGSRAALLLSTWMKANIDHTIRLGFSNAPGRGQTPVKWRVIPTIPVDSVAETYYQTLCDLHHNYPTIKIVEWLARQERLLTLQQPEAFLDALVKLNQPYIILRRVKAGRGRSTEVCILFTSGAATHLQPDEQTTLLAWLLHKPTADNLTVVAAHWCDALTAPLADVTAATLTRRAGEPLEQVLTRLCDLGCRVGKLVDVLETALHRAATGLPSTPTVRSDPEPHTLISVIRVLHRYLADLGDDQRIRTLLWSEPRLRYEFALQAADYPQDARQRLDWLDAARRSDASDLTVFRIALNLTSTPVDRTMLDPLAQAGASYVRRLLELTVTVGSPGADQLVPVIHDWFAAQSAQLDEREWRAWFGLLLRSCTSLPKLVTQCADYLSAHTNDIDPIIVSIHQELLERKHIDSIAFTDRLLRELWQRKVPSEQIFAIEAKLVQHPQAIRYVQQLIPEFSDQLERMQRLLPLMRAQLPEHELQPLLDQLATLAKANRPSKWRLW